MKDIRKPLSAEPESSRSSDFGLEEETQKGLVIVDFSYREFEAIIGSEFAKWGLSDVQTGRRISKGKVETIKRAIASGNYKMTSDPIRFGAQNPKTKSRPLYDGAHRLSAIAQGEIAVRSRVVFEFPKELWTYLDSHRPRLASDLIANVDESVHHTTRLAAAARVTWHMERRIIPSWSPVSLSNAEVMDVLERHGDLYHWTAEVMRGPLKMGGVAACVYWLMATNDPRAQSYISDLIGPKADLHITDPIYLLREKILDNSVYLSRNNKGRADLMGLIFHQWRHFTQGKIVHLVRLQKFSFDQFPWPGGAPYLQAEMKLSA
jgi:hypothetical protein